MRRPRNLARVVSFVVIGACLLAVPALAQDCPELVGRWSGFPWRGVSSVAVSGDYLFSAGSDFLVADVSDPLAPAGLGFAEGTGGLDIAVSGTHAYVVGSSQLRVIDVSNVSAPVQVGSIDTPGSAHAVAVWGSYAYVGDGWKGLRDIDVSTPTQPMEVGSVDMPGFAAGVAASGDYAHVANVDSGLRVINVSNPAMPFEVGFNPSGARADTLAVCR